MVVHGNDDLRGLTLIARCALEQRVGAGGRAGVEAVARGLCVVRSAVGVVVGHGLEARVVALPVDGAAPAAVVHLAHDEDVARSVPSEAAGVEDELVPADHFLEVALVDEGHATGEGRHGRSRHVGHVGHPDAHVLHVVAVGAFAVPAEATHGGGGHTGLGQFGSSEELRGQAVVVEVVHREVARGAGAALVADEGFERHG